MDHIWRESVLKHSAHRFPVIEKRPLAAEDRVLARPWHFTHPGDIVRMVVRPRNALVVRSGLRVSAHDQKGFAGGDALMSS
jgi:hypothetical protein